MINRRDFGRLAGAGAFTLLSTSSGPVAEAQLAAQHEQTPGLISEMPQHSIAHIPPRAVEWPARTYRRLLVDTHVPDWDDRLLASFNAKDYVSRIAAAGFQSLMQYANSHVGLCLWKTSIGQQHRNMKGRDYFGEVMEECKRHRLHRVAYYSLVYDDWAYRNYPEWRIQPAAESNSEHHERTGAVCINSPYTQHAIACIKELIASYDFESIYFDMSFWPSICYCSHCAARYRKEHGGELPLVVDWNDAEWRTFQRSRERWMREFTLSITEAARQTRPIDAYHQFGTCFAPWTVAVSLEQNEASAFAAGDFYGGAAQFSLVCKTYLSLTRKRPFEFQTSRTLNLNDFETTKPFEQLALESMIPMIHSASCLLIDAIKPDGTLNSKAYEYLSQINAIHDAYEPFLGGELQADVAIYYDKGSMYDPDAKGLTAAEAAKNPWSINNPHLDATVGAARILREAHIPFGVVTNISLDQLSRYRAVILPNVTEMTTNQASVFREFVSNGGALYASGSSSMRAPGEGEERFLLADVLGVHYLGRTGNTTTYLSTSDTEVTQAIWPQENIGFNGNMIHAEADSQAEVLATITLPFVDPNEGTAINTRFAQIWSNPPDTIPGTLPGIVMHSFGKGTAIWTAAPLEAHAGAVNARIFEILLARVLAPPFHFEASTSRSVEITLFHQAEKQSLLVGMLNLQQEMPTIPVDAAVGIHLPANSQVRQVSLLPDQQPISHTHSGAYVRFKVPPFKLICMVLIHYAQF